VDPDEKRYRGAVSIIFRGTLHDDEGSSETLDGSSDAMVPAIMTIALTLASAPIDLAARKAARRAMHLRTRAADEASTISFGSGTLGDIKDIKCDSTVCQITASTANTSGADAPATVALRLYVHGSTIVRWWAQLDGNFSDIGAAADVLVGHSPVALAPAVDKGNYGKVGPVVAPDDEPAVYARVYKSPCRLSLVVGDTVLMSEALPLSWNRHSMWQTSARDVAPSPTGLSKEWFFGGGMQNGRWSHRDTSITIAVDYNWDRGGHPNSAPWYVSSAGFGVLRNTWAPGTYTFGAPVITSHNESSRFDAFIALSPRQSLKEVLGLYTSLTGAPFLPPLYALFLGDSDCYHNERHGNSTRTAIGVADLYVQHQMPHGWMLVNDGYGCGYGEGPVDFPQDLSDLTYVDSLPLIATHCH
jgi:hypothetical protein